MGYFELYFTGLLLVVIAMTLLWFVSVLIKNASIVDPFWGLGFVIAGIFYYYKTDGLEIRKLIVLTLLIIWGLRLSIYLAWRNLGKGEDFRYQKFRKDYGPKRYWWISYFQVFLLQGVLLWLISAPLLGAQFYANENTLNFFDYAGILAWIIGFAFEAGGDFQLARFKSNPDNKGKVLNTGFWKYTRHPNYFGDAAVWWAFGLFSVAAGSYLPLLGSLLMTLLIVKVSGVSLLEQTLINTKPQYKDYVEKTPAFFPWFPKK